jgi:hypothetical protein
VKLGLRVNVSVSRIDLDFVDLRRTRDFPSERDCSVRSISASSIMAVVSNVKRWEWGIRGENWVYRDWWLV